MKQCTGCKNFRPETSEYFGVRNGKFIARCRICERARTAKWVKDNPDKHRAQVKKTRSRPEYRERKREKERLRLEANPEAHKQKLESLRAWKKANPDKVRQHRKTNRKRRAEAYKKFRAMDSHPTPPPTAKPAPKPTPPPPAQAEGYDWRTDPKYSFIKEAKSE